MRLTKGAYREPAELAHERAADFEAAYVSALEILMHGDARPLVATHDPAPQRSPGARGGPSARVTRGADVYSIRPAERRRLVAEGLDVRVYVAYGVEWYGTSCAASQIVQRIWVSSCAP